MINYLFDRFADSNGTIVGINLWYALQPHIRAGHLVTNFGEGDREGLVLVTYSKTYQYENNKQAWEPLVEHCRGIIFDTTNNYEIVALPFSKFFNYGEGDIHYPSPGAKITNVFSKLDGSLGILFYWKGKWHLTTRGSLNSDIGVVGQKHFDRIYDPKVHILNVNNTYLFEIIDPICQIVVQYYDNSTVALLGCRNKLHGLTTLGRNAIHLWPDYSQNYSMSSREEILEFLTKTKGTEFEGFVVHYDDGSVFKFKSEDYMRLHRIIAQFTFKRVLEAVQLHQEEEIRKALPEELIPEFDQYIDIIKDKVEDIITHVDKVVQIAPKDSRKEFALHLQQFYKGTYALKYAFKLLDFEMNTKKLGEYILQSLRKDDFEVVENKNRDDID